MHEHEYEMVQHLRFRSLNIFMVRMTSRMPHVHRDLEIGMILDGSIDLQIGSESYALQTGDLFLINPMESHAFTSSENGALILAIQASSRLMDGFLSQKISFHFSGSPKLSDHTGTQSDDQALLKFLCVKLACTYLEDAAHHEFTCFSLFSQLIYLLLMRLPHEEISPQDYLPMKQKTERILSITGYIDQNFQRKLLLEEIAGKENLSMAYLSHFFKEIMGMSFQEYLKQKRFEYACQQLCFTDASLMDISIGSGFSDIRYLNQVFREKAGISPKEYRQLAREHLPGPEGVLKHGEKALDNTQLFYEDQKALQILAPMLEELEKENQSRSLLEFWK